MPTAWPPRLRPLAFGGDYNPEQWTKAVHEEDVQLMASCGVTAVTIGVFSWALLEPAEGRFEFGWLDEHLDRLAGAGIVACLATPTAAPPAWFSTAYPDTRPVTRDGVRLGLGAREAFCPSAPRYRQAASGIATALARRYREHPALALWHVGNEFGAHVAGCYCPASTAAFRAWLRERYTDLDGLNAGWGTSFWGQQYGDWAEVGPPGPAPMPVNPAQQLDFARFTSEEFRACYVAEREALRAVTPEVPITTNLMAGTCRHLDYWQWRGDLDVVANNHYLPAEDPRSHVDLALAADLSRGLAGGRPWLLSEHSTSAVNWQPRNIAKAPGQMRRNSLAHVARGADGVMFFQWRASRFGAEKYHSAMLPQAGTGSRVWREVKELGRDLRALQEVAGSRVHAELALVWDWQSWWALELDYRPSSDVSYLGAVRRWYGALWRANRTVDVVPPDGDLGAYRAVFVPNLYLLTDRAAARLREFVAGGGWLLAGFFSGIVDETDTVPAGPYPGQLRDVLGLAVEEFHPLRRGEQVRIAEPASGRRLHGDVWSEEVRPTTAEAVRRFADGPDAGLPALTRNALGAGAAWYLATRLPEADLAAVFDLVLSDAGLPAQPAAQPAGSEVEVVRRRGEGADYLFVINHDPAAVTVPARGVDLLTGRSCEGEVGVPGGGVAVVREDAGSAVAAAPGGPGRSSTAVR